MIEERQQCETPLHELECGCKCVFILEGSECDYEGQRPFLIAVRVVSEPFLHAVTSPVHDAVPVQGHEVHLTAAPGAHRCKEYLPNSTQSALQGQGQCCCE